MIEVGGIDVPGLQASDRPASGAVVDGHLGAIQDGEERTSVRRVMGLVDGHYPYLGEVGPAAVGDGVQGVHVDRSQRLVLLVVRGEPDDLQLGDREPESVGNRHLLAVGLMLGADLALGTGRVLVGRR